MTEPVATDTSTAAPTLRQRLLTHVLLPVFIVWLTSTVVVIGIANLFTQRAFDRALVDDAFALSAHIHADSGVPKLDLSARELASVLYDQSERVFFAVSDLEGRVVAANAPWLVPRGDDVDLPSGEGSAGEAPYVLTDRFHDGETLRSVDLLPADGRSWRLRIAQTVHARTRLLQQLLLYAVVPEVLLFLLLGAWLRRAIGRDVEPLIRMSSALQSRDVRDLSPISIDASSRDVAQVARSANALFERVRDGIHAQREFAGNVAHELRNPLAGIRALAEYGLKQTDPARWREQLVAILDKQGQASHLVDQLLALAFADEARDTVALSRIDLGIVVERCVLAALPQMDQQRIELLVQGLDEPVFVSANEGLLAGVLTNLLDNALRYGRPGGGGAAEIVIDIRREGDSPDGHLVLEVRDNGPGIPASQADVKSRWVRGTGVEGTRGGTGLGLAIVTRYAELLGTTLELRNLPDAGLSASIRLKVAPPIKPGAHAA